MRTLAKKLSWIVAPFALLTVLELFVLPEAFFNHHLWTPMTVKDQREHLPGRFYPGLEFRKMETGDLSRRTGETVEKEILWVTDTRGERNRSPLEEAEILILGDSMAVGAGLTQEDTLGEQLARATGMKTYTRYLEDTRALLHEDFSESPRLQTLILQTVQRDLVGQYSRWRDRAPEVSRRVQFLDGLFVLWDRLNNLNWYMVAKSRVHDAIDGAKVYPRHGGFFFLEGFVPSEEAGRRWAQRDPEVRSAVESLVTISTGLRSKVGRVVILLVPDKESVYADLAPAGTGTWKEREYALFISLCREKGLVCPDLLTAMKLRRALEPDRGLYHTDDSHWNAAGVAQAVDLLKLAP